MKITTSFSSGEGYPVSISHLTSSDSCGGRAEGGAVGCTSVGVLQPLSLSANQKHHQTSDDSRQLLWGKMKAKNALRSESELQSIALGKALKPTTAFCCGLLKAFPGIT